VSISEGFPLEAAAVDPVVEDAQSPRGRPPRNVGLWVSATTLVVVVLACFVGPMLLGADATKQSLGQRLKPPFWLDGSVPGKAFGTDAFGRDMLARTLEGGRVSLEVGFGAATGAVLIGVLLGLVAGYRGGWVDRAVMAVSDVWIAFPFLVLALAAVAVVGSSVPVLIALLTLGGWVLPTRVTRTIAQRLRGEDYVMAAAGAGATDGYIIRKHILPQVIPANLVVWSFTVGTLVIIEGALSFLGLGVKPPQPSWGNILSDGVNYLETAWWICLWPALMLVTTVIATNGLGTGLRRRWESGATAVDVKDTP
jgi:peptide/nickel transport system permease protein